MGAWGAKLYQDDVAEDVRSEFKDMLRRGKTSEEITRHLIEQNGEQIEDPDDGPIFWFALADTQWNLGRLLPEVKEQALVWLDRGGDLSRWEEENPKLAVQRRKVLEELRQKLNMPQPPEKKIPQYRLYECEWKMRDVFAYRMESEIAKEKGLYGQYLLIQKVAESTWHPGHTIPITYVKITQNGMIPTSAEEFDQLEYVQVSFTTDKKSEIKYEFDEYGYLPLYRIRLLNTSKKIIPSKLIYVGNYPETTPPLREFVSQDRYSNIAVSWEEFERKLISHYFGYNKREYQCYQTNPKGRLERE